MPHITGVISGSAAQRFEFWGELSCSALPAAKNFYDISKLRMASNEKKTFRNHNNLNCNRIFRAKRQLSLIPLNRTAALPAALSNLTRPWLGTRLYSKTWFSTRRHAVYIRHAFVVNLCMSSAVLLLRNCYISIIMWSYVVVYLLWGTTALLSF